MQCCIIQLLVCGVVLCVVWYMCNQGPVARRPRPNNRHPNIGHAIAGLAREGNGLDFDDVEELTWARVCDS